MIISEDNRVEDSRCEQFRAILSSKVQRLVWLDDRQPSSEIRRPRNLGTEEQMACPKGSGVPRMVAKIGGKRQWE